MSRVSHSQLDADAQNCLSKSSFKNSIKDEFRRRLNRAGLGFSMGKDLQGHT